MVIRGEREKGKAESKSEEQRIRQGRRFCLLNVQVFIHNHCYNKKCLQLNIHSNNNNNNKNSKSRNRTREEEESRERTLPGHEKA